jgi:hypothetical protein
MPLNPVPLWCNVTLLIHFTVFWISLFLLNSANSKIISWLEGPSGVDRNVSGQMRRPEYICNGLQEKVAACWTGLWPGEGQRQHAATSTFRSSECSSLPVCRIMVETPGFRRRCWEMGHLGPSNLIITVNCSSEKQHEMGHLGPSNHAHSRMLTEEM